MPAVIKRFEGFTGGGSGINLFGTPELTASLTPVTILGRELVFNDWLYYLSLDGRADRLRDRLAAPARADGARASARCATARPRRSRRA